MWLRIKKQDTQAPQVGGDEQDLATPLLDPNLRITIRNDEPTGKDTLNREQYAEAFARLAETCETPLVVGLYGSWGVGKTSLMKLIQKKLDRKKTGTVWFEAWQHQSDDNPAVSLLQTMLATFRVSEEVKKLVTVIAAAFGSALVKATVNVKASDIQKFGERYEEERFLVRDKQARLRERFEQLIKKMIENNLPEGGRLVFFIDDLDRCGPEKVLRLLEALKLFLNQQDCIYFLGVDRETLEESIGNQYKDIKLNQVSYLDKIVQLPFDIPPIAPESMEDFVTPLLPDDLKGCKDLLVQGLGENPRQVKRFINTLMLCNALAKGLSIVGYDPCILSLVLLLQVKSPVLYRALGVNPGLLSRLKNEAAFRDKELEGSDDIKALVQMIDIPKEPIAKEYVFLTRAARIERDKPPEYSLDLDPKLAKILSDHGQWVRTGGAKGSRADLADANLAHAVLTLTDLTQAILTDAKLSNAKLSNAKLSNAKLSNADLTNAYLTYANLTYANLTGANLTGANLTGANLTGANLTNARLTGADLTYANLIGAHLTGADLDGAHLTGARVLEHHRNEARFTDEQWRSVIVVDADTPAT